MTEREKIIEILKQTSDLWKEEESHGYIVSVDLEKLADALIAAGIGDVKEAKKEVEYWKSEVKTARADIDDAVKEITEHIFTELRDWFVDQSAYAVDYNQHLGYYDYEIKASDVVCDIVEIAEKYGVELGVKDDD